MALVKIALHGVVCDPTSLGMIPAKTSDASRVDYFIDDKERLVLDIGDDGKRYLKTDKGYYTFIKHPTQNYWVPEDNNGTCGGLKVQISLKQIVGELRYWTKN